MPHRISPPPRHGWRRALASIVAAVACLATRAPGRPSAHERAGALLTVRPNSNLDRAGMLRDGILSVALEARESQWWLNGSDRPPIRIAAFAEPGKAPLMPAPLLRAPAGTELRLSIRNSLRLPLTFFVPASIHGGPDRMDAMDSVVVAPGTLAAMSVRATSPGTYVYRAATPLQAHHATRIAGLLTGAVIVDTAGANTATHDRVFVIMETGDSVVTACADTTHSPNPGAVCPGRTIFTINGRSWPHTEPLAAMVGDSLRWRVVNASPEPHPMHLHGFYYRVDAFSGPLADLQGRPAPGQLTVTQLMTQLSGMSITWSPDRPGNWVFHCHFAQHLMPDSISAAADDPHMRGMTGLVLRVAVAGRPGMTAAGEPVPTRHLRLVAVTDRALGREHPGSRDEHNAPLPLMRFVLDGRDRPSEIGKDISSELDLTRGEPVSITIVNHLDEPTSVHWHGIEVQDSYVDGVPGVSGDGARLSPAIAPADSFVARFTPPRSGTFMYHAHVDELREQQAGLEGALIVRDPGVAPSPDDHVFFLKDSHLADGGKGPLEINGQVTTDTVVMHAGRPARLRLLSLTQYHNATTALMVLTARSDPAPTSGDDSLVVRWRPLAKDGADLPDAARAERPARQVVGMGETYDFEFTPRNKGTLHLEVRGAGPAFPRGRRPFLRVPIRVE